jgi:hypothetical protein
MISIFLHFPWKIAINLATNKKNPKIPLIGISTFAQKWKSNMMQESSTYMVALMANLPTLFL